MLSDERILEIAGSRVSLRTNYDEDGYVFDKKRFARAIEREATATLIERIILLERKLALFQQGKFDERMYQAGIEQEKQIKEDEALMRDVLEAMTAEPEMREGACSVATEALRERLEAKK